MTGYGQAFKHGVVARLLPPECAFVESASLDKGDKRT